MKDNNSKFPLKYSSSKSLQFCSYMFRLFSDKFKIHNTHSRNKNILLKTNKKRNSTTGSSVKRVTYCNQILYRYNTIFLSHTGLKSLNQVFDRLRKKNASTRTHFTEIVSDSIEVT